MKKGLYKCFLNRRERNFLVSTGLIKLKALSFCKSEPLATNEIRHGIRFLKITHEKLSSQPNLVNTFKQEANIILV